MGSWNGVTGREMLSVICVSDAGYVARGSASVSIAGILPHCREERVGATSGLSHRNRQYHYSITSSARPSSVIGTVRPSALAVLRLMTSSILVTSCTGRSAGFSPLRMRPT
jgi:hypothetical protein